VLDKAHGVDSVAEETVPTFSTANGTRAMRHQPTVLDQVLQHLPWGVFDRLVAEHEGDARCRGFRSRDHLIALLAAALGGHHGLRQAVAALAPNRGPLRLAGAQAPARSTLSDASRHRPAALFTAFFQALLPSLAARAPRRDLREAVRLIDATQLDLGRRMIGWLGLHRGQVAAKRHLVFDPRAERPVLFEITPARVNDLIPAKRALPIEPGATYVFDLGYYDFAWWASLDAAGCRFVTRLKRNTPFRVSESRAVAPDGAALADRIGRLPERLAASRRNPFVKPGREIVLRRETGRCLRLFTNDLTSPAEAIAALYKERWQIELFFKWIKQNLRISRFLGTSENAVRTQVATALIAYLLVRATKLRHRSELAATTLLTVIRSHLFTRKPIPDLLSPPPRTKPPPNPQLSLFKCKT
jgi:hypothetical protein